MTISGLFIIKRTITMVFFINKNATLPNLRMEVINDGRNDFNKLYLAMQSADVTFTMTNAETGIRKIAKATADIIPKEDAGCEEEFIIEYKWKPRDTNESGNFIGQFNINFDGNIVMEGKTFPSGNLIVPIAEDLLITINDSNIKK